MSQVTTTHRRPFPIWVVLLLAVGALFVAWIGYLYWLATITIIGTEFSPYSFSARSFRYVMHWRNTPDTPWTVCATEITKHLSNSTTAPGTDRWDAVKFSKGFQVVGSIGEAALLYDRINNRTGQGENWEEWSKTHAKRAAVLWPAVQQLAIHRAYFAIPELLDQARLSNSEKEFAAQLQSICRTAVVDQANRFLSESHTTEARSLLEWGKSLGESNELREIESKLETLASPNESKR